jgi:hypothetical protein
VHMLSKTDSSLVNFHFLQTSSRLLVFAGGTILLMSLKWRTHDSIAPGLIRVAVPPPSGGHPGGTAFYANFFEKCCFEVRFDLKLYLNALKSP